MLFEIPIITYSDYQSVTEALESIKKVDDKHSRINISAIESKAW